jgi:hypothetical protein
MVIILSIMYYLIGITYLKRQLAISASSSLIIYNKDQKWNIVAQIYLPLGLTLSSRINCTDGVEFDYSLFLYK